MTDLGVPPERSGKSFGQIFWSLACLLAALVIIWLVLPDWMVRPNKEASPERYYQVSLIGDNEAYNSGKCPALQMAAAKALSDRKLTAREVHDLKVQGINMTAHNSEINAKNQALQNVGLKPSGKEIDCPRGDSIFTS